MKNLKFFIPIIILLISTFESNAQLQVRNDPFIQIGYEDYRVLSFGEEPNYTPNNGKYAIEYWDVGVGGLNFWKPWPTPGAANYVLWLRDDRNVSVGGYGSSAYKFMVYGSSYSTGSWIGSDRKLKSEIQPINNGAKKIMKLQPKSYVYNFSLDKYNNVEGKELDEIKKNTIEEDNAINIKTERTFGFIADEVKEIFPELVKRDEEGLEAINYDGLIPVLVVALQEQQRRIVRLEKALKEK